MAPMAAHVCAPPHAQHFTEHLLTPPCPATITSITGISAAPQPNGYSLVNSLRRLNLPAVSSDATFAAAWRCLKQRFEQLPDELLVSSPHQHAMLAFLCYEWADAPSGLSVDEFIRQTFQGKLYPEVRWLGSHRIGCYNKTWLRLCGAELVDESCMGVYVCARVFTGCPRCL